MNDSLVSRRAQGDVYIAKHILTHEYVCGGHLGDGELKTTTDVFRAVAFDNIGQAQGFLGPFKDSDQFEICMLHRKVVIEQGGTRVVNVPVDFSATTTREPEKRPMWIVRVFRGVTREWEDNENMFRIKFCMVMFTLSNFLFWPWYLHDKIAHRGEYIVISLGACLLVPLLTLAVGFVVLMMTDGIIKTLNELANRGK